MRVVHQDIILVIKELVTSGGIGGLMEGFVKHIGILGGSLAENDVVLGDLPCRLLRDAIRVSSRSNE